MNDVERLIAIEEIKKLKARYFRCVDTKDWAGLAEVFAPDIAWDRTRSNKVRDPWTGAWDSPIPEAPIKVIGRDNVVAMVRGAVEPYHTQHHGHMPEIDILDETHAAAIWTMTDTLWTKQREVAHSGSGHYHETYEKLDGRWFIKTSYLLRLHLYWGPGGGRKIGFA